MTKSGTTATRRNARVFLFYVSDDRAVAAWRMGLSVESGGAISCYDLAGIHMQQQDDGASDPHDFLTGLRLLANSCGGADHDAYVGSEDWGCEALFFEVLAAGKTLTMTMHISGRSEPNVRVSTESDALGNPDSGLQ